MQDIFQKQILVAIKHTVERSADDEKKEQSWAIDEGDQKLIRRLRTEEQKKEGVRGWENPETVRNNVSDVFNL